MTETNPYLAPNADWPTCRTNANRSPINRWKVIVWSLTYTYPLLVAAGFYSSWLIAWMCLGHMPRPMLDDPKQIGGIMDFAYMLSMFVLFSALILTPLCFASSFVCPLRLVRGRVTEVIALAFGYIAISGGLFSLLRLDPGRVVEWSFD